MNIEKRIKRHIWAKKHSILITQIPPFRDLTARELTRAGCGEYRITPHGIYLDLNLEDIYRLHLKLATASRIWLIAAEFRAGATEELYRRTAGIPWELYLSPALPLRIDARVRRSRIRHEGAAAETLREGLSSRLTELELPVPPRPAGVENDTPVQRLELIAEDNRVELRIDLSGEHLHRRGYRRLVGEAPLRENLAAGLLRWALDAYGETPLRILDPFCGSGTIPIEAALYAADAPPGIGREFLFQRQPHFREAAYAYLRRTLQAAILENPSIEIVGSDIESVPVDLARRNAEWAGRSIKFLVADAFSHEVAELLGPGTLVITNPPYGDRLKGGVSLYRRLIGLLQNTETPGALIIPRKLEAPLGLSPAPGERCFDNGGIEVALHLFIPVPPQRTR